MKKLIFIIPVLLLIGVQFISAQDVTFSNVLINGTIAEGNTVYGFYSCDPDSLTDPSYSFNWSVYDGSDNYEGLLTETSYSLDLDNSLIGKKLRFVVTVSNIFTTSVSDSSALSAAVPANQAPTVSNVLISKLSSNMNVGSTLLGSYDYSDNENDPEGSSTYQWYKGSTFGSANTLISGAEDLAYVIDTDDQGEHFKFTVRPVASTGDTDPGTPGSNTNDVGAANSAPSISGLSIESTISIGGTITADYTYSDPDTGDDDACTFRWFKDGDEFVNNSATYSVLSEDQSSEFYVIVTAVSGGDGFPNTGNTLISNTCTVSVSVLPLATNVCIKGDRRENGDLKPYYTYDENGVGGDEGNSIGEWLVNGVVVQTGIVNSAKPWLNKYYLHGDTIDIDDIVLRLTPKKKNSTITGLPVSSAPLMKITNVTTSFSITSPPVLLGATPELEIFTGGGVYDVAGVYYFDPSDTSDFNIDNPVQVTHTIETDVGGCTQKAFIDFDVNSATTYFLPYEEIYCYTTPSSSVSIGGLPPEYFGNGDFTMIPDIPGGMSGETHNSVTIHPPAIGPTANTDVFLNYDYDILVLIPPLMLPSSIHFQIQKRIVVDSVGQDLKIINLSYDYCQEEDPSILSIINAYPAGGSGNWEQLTTDLYIDKNDFSATIDPALKNPAGSDEIRYTYTTPLGCSKTVIVPIAVHPTPDLDFDIADGCIESDTDTTVFINTSPDFATINSWYWEFGEAITQVSDLPEPKFMYRTEGKRTITLIGTTTYGCVDTVEIEKALGVKPEGDFYWEDDCFSPGVNLKLFDNSKATSTIDSLFWVFKHGALSDTVFNVLNPEYIKTLPEILNVEYFLLTQYPGCYDTVKKNIYIRPYWTLKDSSYTEDFEGSGLSWVKDTSYTSTWELGLPEYLIGNEATSKAWFTDTLKTGYVNYAVESPCFDFTDVKRPMISMEIVRYLDEGRNGAVLQYKVGDDPVWKNIGGTDFGIEWYDNSNITGKPGGSVVGWSTEQNDNNFVQARQYLDDLKDLTNVKLRIAYGSDGSAQDTRGFAFDNVWMGERSRNVLVEHFTNYNYSGVVSADNSVNTIVDNISDDAMNIQYHTNYFAGDQLYLDNDAVPSSRMLFYGLTSNPYTIYDGGYSNSGFAKKYDFTLANANEADLKNRSMIDPLFKLRVDTNTVDPHSFKVILEPLQTFTTESTTLYLAIVAKKITSLTGGNGQTEFRNVLRKMIPDAAGINLKKNWASDEGETEFGPYMRTVPSAYDSDSLEVIAFLQNNNTKEVYQAATSGSFKSYFTSIGRLRFEEAEFSLFPNPASSHLTLLFDSEIKANSKITIINNAGIAVKNISLQKGINRLFIDDLNLPDGFYMLSLIIEGKPAGIRKLIISR